MPRHAVEQRTKREIVEDLLHGPAMIRPDFGALPVSFRLSGMPWGGLVIDHQMDMIDRLDSGRLTLIEAEISPVHDMQISLNPTNLVSVNNKFTLYKARDYLFPQSDEISSTSLHEIDASMSHDSRLELAAALLIALFKYGPFAMGSTMHKFTQQLEFESTVLAKKADEGYDIHVAGQYMTNTAFITGPSARPTDFEEMQARYRKLINRLESANVASLD
jgi:hypothetical protein